MTLAIYKADCKAVSQLELASWHYRMLMTSALRQMTLTSVRFLSLDTDKQFYHHHYPPSVTLTLFTIRTSIDSGRLGDGERRKKKPTKRKLLMMITVRAVQPKRKYVGLFLWHDIFVCKKSKKKKKKRKKKEMMRHRKLMLTSEFLRTHTNT